MPLTELDPNRSGRTSRASDISSRFKDTRQPGTASTTDSLSSNPGIYGMLKTTTETGDIGMLSMRPSRLPAIPNGNSRRLPPNTLSRSSSHYSHQGLSHSRRTSGQSGRDTLLLPPRNQFHGIHRDLQYRSSDARSIADSDSRQSSRHVSQTGSDVDGRSYSFTSQQQPAIPYHRSLTSLRGYGPGPRTRPPYGYPSRFRRPGHRPDSPALSDTAGVEYHYTDRMRPRPSPRAHSTSTYTIPDGDSKSFHSDFNRPSRPSGIDYHEDSAQPLPIAVTKIIQAARTPPPTRTNGTSQGTVFASGQYEAAQSSHGREPRSLLPTPGNAHYRVAAKPITPPFNRQPGGLVQRVKTILEEKISLERSDWKAAEKRVAVTPEPVVEGIVELPASPVVKRLTRDMIKAAVDPSSDIHRSSEVILYSIESVEDADANPPLGLAFAGSSSPAKIRSVDISEDKTDENGSPASVGTNVTSVNNTPSNDNGLAFRFSVPGSFPETDNEVIAVDAAEQVDCPVARTDTVCIEPDEPHLLDIHAQVPHDETPDAQKKPVSKTSVGKSLPTRVVSHWFSATPKANTVGTHDSVVSSRSAPEFWNGDPEPSTENGGRVETVGESDLPDNLGFRKSRRYSRSTHKSDSAQPMSLRTSRLSFQAIANSITAAASSPRALSVPEYLTDVEPQTVTYNQDRSSTTDLRFSSLRNSRFPLPDLTEDSQEDASTSNSRILGSRHALSRSSGFVPGQDKSRHPDRVSGGLQWPRSYLSRSFTDDRTIPSLNFSRMDLLAKLNQALGVRSSRSLDDIRGSGAPDWDVPTPERPASSSILRDRYKSFFSIDDISPSEDDDAMSKAQVRSLNEDLITEINRLSVPSVNGLTQRLSELLPSITHGHAETDDTQNDEPAASTSDTARGMDRPDTLVSIASDVSAEQGTIFRRPTVRSGSIRILDTVPRELNLARLMKELPPLPHERTRDQLSQDTIRQKTFAAATAHGNGEPPAGVAELDATAPVAAARKPQFKTIVHNASSSPRRFKLKRSSNRSLAGSPASARLWNFDDNYPWSNGSSARENFFPPEFPRLGGSPTRLRRFRLKSSRSIADLPVGQDETVRIIRSMSPGPVFNASLIPQTDLFTEPEQTTPAKKSIFGSLSRKIGIRPRIDKAGFPVDPDFLHPEDRPVDPGDRYPTTGLNPPTGLNIDEARSFFSDNSSHSDHVGNNSLRKRLTRFKPKMAPLRIVSPAESRSDIHRDNDGAVFEEGPEIADHEGTSARNAAGMSRAEFRKRKVVDKIRNFWFKSGELLRSMSKAKKLPPNWSEENNV